MKKTIRMLVACVLLGGGCATRPFVSAAGHRLVVLDHGIYVSQLHERLPHDNFTSGGVRIRKNYVLQKQTRDVPATPGTRFGFRYIIDPSDSSREVPVTVQWFFPSPGLTNPKTGRRDRMNKVTYNAPTKEDLLVDYGFDHAWECVPGTWEFRLLVDGHVAIQEKFLVHRPKE